jgi:biopolymer transport protein ExbB
MPEWFIKGGIAMWPLLVCSVAGVAIVLERVWALQRKRVLPAPLANAIEKQGGSPDLKEKVKVLSESQRSVLGELVQIVLGHTSLAKHENVEAVQAAARQIGGRMERGLTSLALIAELGPLLGLLGTVHGMLRLFGDVAAHGLADPAVISHGIYEALHATFAGLAVAVPALIAYMFLRRRIDNLSLELERHVNELLTRLYR